MKLQYFGSNRQIITVEIVWMTVYPEEGIVQYLEPGNDERRTIQLDSLVCVKKWGCSCG